MSKLHLSQEQIERCLSFTLSAEEIPGVYAHLDQCAKCRNRTTASAQPAAPPSSQESGLLLQTLDDTEWLLEEQIADYADDLLDPIERAHVESLLEGSPASLAAMEQISALRDRLASLPPIEIAPLPHRERTAETVATPVATRSLPVHIAERMQQLLTQGIVEPLESVRIALQQMQRIAAAMQQSMGLQTVRSSDLPAPELLSPNASAVSSLCPHLRWTPTPQAQTYRVVLSLVIDEARRQLLWKHDVGAVTDIVIPEEIALAPGNTYLWQVAARLPEQELRSPVAMFLTLAQTDQKALEAEEAACSSSELALLSVYEAYGLYAQARSLAQSIVEREPHNAPAVAALERLESLLTSPKQ